jgi:hypothetical protein
VAKESDFAASEAQLFPQQAHEAVGLGAGVGVAMAAGGYEDSCSLRRAGKRTRGLIGETLNYQRMAGVDGVVMNGGAGVLAAGFGQDLADGFALPDVEIESGGYDEDLGCLGLVGYGFG